LIGSRSEAGLATRESPRWRRETQKGQHPRDHSRPTVRVTDCVELPAVFNLQSANKTRQDRCGYKLVAASYWLLAKAEETTLPGIWYLVIGSGRKPKAKATTRASSCWLLAASKSTEPRFLGIWYLVIGQKPKPKAKPRRRGLLCPCKPKSGCNGKPHSRGCLYPCKPKPGLHGGPRCATCAIWAQNQKSAGHRRCREAFNGANRD
jgi:hypothetical protein